MNWRKLFGLSPKREPKVDNQLTRSVAADPEGWKYFVDSMNKVDYRAKKLLARLDQRKQVDSQAIDKERVE